MNLGHPRAALTQARHLLNPDSGVEPTWAPRAAALIARNALEGLIVEACARVGADVADPAVTTRVRLIVLRALAGGDVADPAEVAWAGLSAACHHHAYELSPTPGEVAHLISLVDDLAGVRGT